MLSTISIYMIMHYLIVLFGIYFQSIISCN